MTRDELLWRMAEGAWGHHYCAQGARGDFCEACQSNRSSSGKVECFELSGGFKRGAGEIHWKHTAEGALAALEAATGVKFVGKQST